MLKEQTWSDVRDEVLKVSPELAQVIDNLSPNKKLTFIRAKYHFGDLILDEGKLQLPSDNGKLISLAEHPEKNMVAKLSYSKIPLFVTLQKCNEVFIDTGARVIPLNLFYPGSILGLFETFDALFDRRSDAKWSVSAGARSTFMLAKIYGTAGFRKLRTHYQLPSNSQLQQLSDHWAIFKGISQHRNFTQDWQNEILFFTEEWFKNFHKNDPAWMPFYRYLMKSAWSQAQFAIGKVDLRLYWEHFINLISAKNLKPIPFISDQIKHIMLIAAGQWPGFRYADASQLIAPTQGIQDAFVDIYQLKTYLPIIMHPDLLKKDNSAVYYSLAHPTLLEGSPNRQNKSTIMIDIKEIKMLFDILLSAQRKKADFETSSLENIKLDYFHVENDPSNEIMLSGCIPEYEPGILSDQTRFPNRTFCTTSPFWRGSIRIGLEKL